MWENILAASIVLIVFIIIVIAIYYLTSLRGMKKQKEHFKRLHQELGVGKKIQFSNGMYGTVKHISDDILEVQVKSGAVIEVSRYAVTEIL